MTQGDQKGATALTEGKHTHPGRADNCCTDAETGMRGRYRAKNGPTKREKGENKSEERIEGKKEKFVLQAVIVTWVLSARKSFRNLAIYVAVSFLLLPIAVSSVNTAAVAPPPIEQLYKRQTKTGKIQGLVEPMPSHTIYHFVSALVGSCISTAAPPNPLLLSPFLASSAAWYNQLLSVLSLYHFAMKLSAAPTTPPLPLPTLVSHPRP